MNFLVVTMGRLDAEAKTTMSFLMRNGQSKSEVARLLGVTEGAVRYHAKRKAAGAVDGRSHQKSKAEPFAGPIADWHGQHKEAGVSLPALYAWLRDEHGFEGSLRAVQRYYKQIFPAPAIRARRRGETVIGAQAQVDWAEFPMVPLGNEIVDLSALVVTLSWSRKRAVIWSRSKCMLSWQSAHLSALQRLGGVPAVLRIDNVKTAIASGAGAWGKINETYRAFARDLKFHIDDCQPRYSQAKGKVELAVQDLREVIEERRIKAMLKVSKIPTGQTLENFDFAFQPAIERSRIETLATGSWIRGAEVLLLQGPPGVGKSHLLVALGIRAIELGFSAQYFRFDELMTALKADAHLPASRIKARKYMSTALLLIDEMGYDPMNRQEASLFFRLVSHRYGRGAMIITTNKTVRDWPELLAGDEVLATAILDRLLHRAHVLNIRGRSYRLRDLEASLKN